MKILKYQKTRNNEYKIFTDIGEYKLYDDIIIKYELLLNNEIKENKWNEILEDNKLLEAYYLALKALNIKMRNKKELKTILKKKNYSDSAVEYAIIRLENEGYLNNLVYIEAYVHDMITLNLVGENKIYNDLISMGFKDKEINPFLAKIDKDVYLSKINKYLNKKAKINKKSINEFKQKSILELINKGFNKEDIIQELNKLSLEENEIEIEKLVNRLYQKYIKKYDIYMTKNKLKTYLYSKGYPNIDIDKYIKKTS